jgi:cellulose synthase/poly-beta-1,6-N-acetylglucosamine synthase-like glycosyltransferase
VTSAETLEKSARTAVLIACKNGEATIGRAVASAASQADVYVVSDGSTDGTAEVAYAAGACRVLVREVSGGKPAALRSAVDEYDLAEAYDFVAVLDDDTTLAPDYVARLEARMDADPGVAVASGRIESFWDRDRRWNPFVAMRAFMYWSYQVTMKRGQEALRVVNVICGANSLFRADLFARLVREEIPYAIDDMFWMAEIARRRLGRVAYVHAARSWTIDPHTFRDWYRQTVRWSWAQFQSIRGHRLAVPVRHAPEARLRVRFSWFDLAYLLLLLDWLGYALEPLLVAPAIVLLGAWLDPIWLLAFYLGSSFAWFAVAAACLRKPRLLVLSPLLLALDLVYRATMLHAIAKAIVQPRSAARWDSPKRFAVAASEGAPAPARVRGVAMTTVTPERNSS